MDMFIAMQDIYQAQVGSRPLGSTARLIYALGGWFDEVHDGKEGKAIAWLESFLRDSLALYQKNGQ